MTEYPAIKILEDSWEGILRELQTIIPGNTFVKWPEFSIYNGTWDVYGIYGIDGKIIKENANRCPFTASVVQQIPGLRTAGFSMLASGCEIKPHKGYTDDVLRCHLGLVIPDGDCALQVEETIYRWEVGKAFVFNDRLLHSAWNRTKEQRYILLVDFYKDGKNRPGVGRASVNYR